MQRQPIPQQGQPAPQKKSSWGTWLCIIGAIVIVYFIMSSSGACGSTLTQKDFNEFTKDIGLINQNDAAPKKFKYVETDGTITPANNIEAITSQGYTYYVLLHNKDNNLQNFRANPKKYASYSFYYPQGYDITAILNAYNGWAREVIDNAQTDPTAPTFLGLVITISPAPESSSWFSFGNILSLASLIVLIIVVYFVFRSFSNRGGLGNMTRNRAQHTMGGSVRFENVAGIEEEKEQVEEIVDFLKNPHKYLELGARIPKGVLLVGQPGTGKTLLAKAIAGEAGVHFFSISGSDFSEMLVGVGPSRMRDLFETAKLNAPSIIFIDEIDSIARIRGVGASGVSEENEQTLNQLLVQMDGFNKSEGVIVLAATNRPDVLDPALLRPGRFDRQIIVQIPDVKGREQILKVHAQDKQVSPDVDLKRVAQIISGFTGADIENLLNEAAIIAAKKDKKKITMADITEGINKVLLGPQKKSRIITEEDKKITAYHESGHAIVSYLTEPDQLVQEVSIIPRGMAAGYTLTNEKDIENHHKSKKFLSNRIAMLMAGRVAEQIFIGDTCTGSSNDIKVATDLAENMVTKYGMSQKLGPLYYGKEEEVALRIYSAQHPHSEALQSVIDGEIKLLVSTAEKTATDLLRANKAKVDTMAQVLLERETIYAPDIDLIMKGKTAKEVTAEIDKRGVDQKAQEQKDKSDNEIAKLNMELDQIMKHSVRYVNAKLASADKLPELEKNFDKARDIVRRGGKLRQLPTLDNIAEYDTIITEAEGTIITPKKPATKKPTPEKGDPEQK